VKIDPPVKFPVNVKGELLTAMADNQVKDPVKYILHIRFSDGYADQFSIDSDGTVMGTTEESKPYAKAIRYDIVHIIGLDTKRFYHVFQYPVYGQLVNVWIIERDIQGEISYAVFYKQFYRFELVRMESRWVPFTKSKLQMEIDRKLANKVARLLDTLL
jgi:hypothetical protein